MVVVISSVNKRMTRQRKLIKLAQDVRKKKIKNGGERGREQPRRHGAFY